MRIQHNITAMNAHRQLGINNTSVGKNLEKLSSGFRINRAGDDAAGLAISEKMRGQIRGLDMASNNAQDGISLIQTAEGNLQETHSILQRMRELAVQSSNGTFESANDRVNLDKEVQALKSEIDRIANSAHFNNTKLLDGNLEKKFNTAATTDAVASKIETNSTVGIKGSAAVAAKYEIDLKGMKSGAGATAPILTINGATLTTASAAPSDIGNDVAGGNWMDDIVTKFNASTDPKHAIFTASTDVDKRTLILTANAAGALDTSTHNEMKKGVSNSTLTTGIQTKTATVTATGSNAGAGTPAKAAAYSFEFNMSKLAGGQTFTIGEGSNKKTFEFVTDGSTPPDNVKIDIAGLDLSDAASTTTGVGQLGVAEKIQAAIEAVYKTAGVGDAGSLIKFNVDAAPVGAVAGNKYTLNMTAVNVGTASNLGAVREDVDVSGTRTDFLVGTQTTVGAAAGTPKPTVFATATLDIDFGKLKAGDKITLNGVTFEAISGSASVDTNATTKQFQLNNAGDETISEADASANFIAAFETAVTPPAADGTGGVGIPVGLAKYEAATAASGTTPAKMGKLTFSSTDVAQDSKTFAAALGSAAFKFEPIDGGAKGATTKGGVVFQIGANGTADDRVSLTIEKQDAATLGIGNINISEIIDANDAITKITDATNKVSSTRADLGALQNRLEHTVANLGTTSENLTAAESRIRDVDMAKEMMEMTKNNILSQAAQAMLAQANQQPQGILQLLR